MKIAMGQKPHVQRNIDTEHDVDIDDIGDIDYVCMIMSYWIHMFPFFLSYAH